MGMLARLLPWYCCPLVFENVYGSIVGVNALARTIGAKALTAASTANVDSRLD